MSYMCIATLDFHYPEIHSGTIYWFSQVQVWDVSSTSKLQQLMLEGGLALDLLPCGREGDCLAVLTASKVFLYQWALS